MIYTPMTKKALSIAYAAHHGQLDHSGLPYIHHPLHLAETMTNELACTVALLHDVVEDTAVTLDDLAKEFPPEVVEAVRLLTHEEGVDYFDYVRAIRTNQTAAIVKLADLAHNGDQNRCIGCDIPEEKLAYWKEKYAKARQILLETEDDVEFFDLYDADRLPTGESLLRGTPTPDGKYRLLVHACVFNSKNEMLIQQRQNTKKWPNLWDLTSGGHVTAGEGTRTSAYRELLEEVGLDIDFTGVRPAVTVAFKDGWDDFYVVHSDEKAEDLVIQLDEVQAVKWATLEEVLRLRENDEFMPYTKSFLEYLFFRGNHVGSHDYQV